MLLFRYNHQNTEHMEGQERALLVFAMRFEEKGVGISHTLGFVALRRLKTHQIEMNFFNFLSTNTLRLKDNQTNNIIFSRVPYMKLHTILRNFKQIQKSGEKKRNRALGDPLGSINQETSRIKGSPVTLGNSYCSTE